jgi:hypothetical protein
MFAWKVEQLVSQVAFGLVFPSHQALQLPQCAVILLNKRAEKSCPFFLEGLDPREYGTNCWVHVFLEPFREERGY